MSLTDTKPSHGTPFGSTTEREQVNKIFATERGWEQPAIGAPSTAEREVLVAIQSLASRIGTASLTDAYWKNATTGELFQSSLQTTAVAQLVLVFDQEIDSSDGTISVTFPGAGATSLSDVAVVEGNKVIFTSSLSTVAGLTTGTATPASSLSTGSITATNAPAAAITGWTIPNLVIY